MTNEKVVFDIPTVKEINRRVEFLGQWLEENKVPGVICVNENRENHTVYCAGTPVDIWHLTTSLTDLVCKKYLKKTLPEVMIEGAEISKKLINGEYKDLKKGVSND